MSGLESNLEGKLAITKNYRPNDIPYIVTKDGLRDHLYSESEAYQDYLEIIKKISGYMPSNAIVQSNEGQSNEKIVKEINKRRAMQPESIEEAPIVPVLKTFYFSVTSPSDNQFSITPPNQIAEVKCMFYGSLRNEGRISDVIIELKIDKDFPDMANLYEDIADILITASTLTMPDGRKYTERVHLANKTFFEMI